MTTQELHDMLTNTTEALNSANANAYEATLDLHEAKLALTQTEGEYILAGLEGKNEAARKAELANLTRIEAENVENANQKLLEANRNVMEAQLFHQLARNLLRLHTSQAQEAALN